MKIKYWFVGVVLAALFAPLLVSASAVKTFTGTVTKIYGSQVYFTNGSAATYSAEIGNIQLLRKNGVVMSFSEILVGDKIEARGTLWGDNSISAIYFKDNSLYAHNSSFTGKISSINPTDSSFVIQSKPNGDQTIFTNSFTAFTLNGKTIGFADLNIGTTVTLQGVWDRSNKKVLASKVAGSFRLISIDFTGQLTMKNGSALTVIGNGNVIYGVDASSTVIKSKNNKDMNLSEVSVGQTLKVTGKHISGLAQVYASKIVDTSVTK